MKRISIFFTGSIYGEVNRTFTQCSQQVQDMADAYAVGKARDHYYNKFNGKPFDEWKPVPDYKGPFGISGLIRAGIDPTEQFVGSYDIAIYPQKNKTLRFEVTNNTSMKCLKYIKS